MAAYILDHFRHLDIGSAVLRPFQGRHGCRNRGVSIGTGRGNDPGSERGIIPAAVLHMKDQGCIQHLWLRYE